MHANAGDRIGVRHIVLDELVGSDVPDLDGAISTAGCNTGVVIVKLNRVNHTVKYDHYKSTKVNKCNSRDTYSL